MPEDTPTPAPDPPVPLILEYQGRRLKIARRRVLGGMVLMASALLIFGVVLLVVLLSESRAVPAVPCLIAFGTFAVAVGDLACIYTLRRDRPGAFLSAYVLLAIKAAALGVLFVFMFISFHQNSDLDGHTNEIISVVTGALVMTGVAAIAFELRTLQKGMTSPRVISAESSPTRRA